MVSPDQTITANDKFIYQTAQRRATAVGNAKVVLAEDTLSANTIEAVFKEQSNEGGQDAVETLEAKGNVVITTPTEVLSGNYAIYRSATNKAEITGNVKITRGPNILEGARAEVDLTTNISKMFGAEETGERVRGVFYPNSEKK
ncbi:MAG: LptA/OstA family protein [Pseudomonadota bacterium]